MRACINRTHYAAELVGGHLELGSVSVIGAHRNLGGAEPQQVREFGLGELDDEADVIVARRARRSVSTIRRSRRRRSGGALPRGKLTPEQKMQLHAAWAITDGDSVEVVIVPSSDPVLRRANTADQLRYWAGLAGIGGGHDVLWSRPRSTCRISTWTPLRVLGLERGCGVYSCGVDAAGSLLPARTFGGREYLQEIRSRTVGAAATCGRPAIPLRDKRRAEEAGTDGGTG